MTTRPQTSKGRTAPTGRDAASASSTPMSTPMSPLRAARAEKILAAAERVFARDGFRATTMEGVAEAVGMSKVTLYGYFGDKDALFLAVCERLAENLERAVAAALSTEGSAAERVAGGLLAKQGIVNRLVRASPFSSELFDAKDRHAAEAYRALDERIVAALADVIASSGGPRAEAEELARLLFAAADGLGRFTSDDAVLGLQIRRLAGALVR